MLEAVVISELVCNKQVGNRLNLNFKQVEIPLR